MTRLLAIALLPIALLGIVALVSLGFGWKLTQWAEGRLSKYVAVEQHARTIDAKAGISPDSPTSATAMARTLKIDDDGQVSYGRLLQSLGILLLIVAGFQTVITIRLVKQKAPSNPTVEGDAPKAARPSP